jgi:emfourin
MRVTLAVHGGLAAGLRLGRGPVVVDTSALTDEDARELTGLLAGAREDPPPAEASRAVPDEQSYTVTVDDGTAQHVLRRSDTTMSQTFADLVDRLQKLGAAAG